MSNDNNKKDINSQIDEILNEIRQQHNSEQTHAAAPETKPQNASAPTQPEQPEAEEEFVDISSPGYTIPSQTEITGDDKKADKKKKKADKKADKANIPESNEANKEQIEIAPQQSSEPVNTSSDDKTDADVILSEIPSLISLEAPIGGVSAFEPSNNGSAKTKTKKGKKGFVIAGIVAVAALLGCSFFAVMALNPSTVPAAAPIPKFDAASNENANEFVFAKGIYIAGTDIGGKTQKEAKALIKIKESDFKDEFSVNVNYGDGKKLTFTNKDFSYTYNTDEVYEQALQYSRDLTTAIKDGTIDKLAIPDDYNVTVDEENGTINFDVSCIVSDSSIEKVVNRSAKKIDKNAVEPHATEYKPNAKSFDKMFKWVDGENGVVIDKEALTKEIKALFKNGAKSGDVDVQTTTEKFKHTIDDVKNNVQLIGQFSTVSTNGYNANANMATALAAIDGTIVDPGKIFSFNECTGDSNLTENGYLSASVIQNEEYVPGIGGGICQAATTIYNAMLLSGMGVEERANHFYTSVYVYGGLDATIDYPNLDLKMKNNSDYQIFVHTWMDGVTLHCEIYGFQPSDWDEIRTESECSWVGSESFGFEAQRVYYKKDKEVKREDLPDSVYSLKNGHYVVAGDPGTESNKIKDPKKNLKIK